MSANIRLPDDPAPERPIEPIRHELRFLLTDSMRDEFAERARTGFATEPQRIRSIHYDTVAGDLWRQGIALKVRAVDGGYLQTVKVRADGHGPGAGVHSARIPADPFDGPRWERVTLTPLPQAAALPPGSSPVGAAIRECLPQLRPVFETDLYRQSRFVVPEEGVRFELASAVGVIRAASGLSEAIDEVELSQQAGPDGIFHRYALHWARLHRASLLTDTRRARGMAMAGFPPADVFPPPRRPVVPAGPLDMHVAARQAIGARLAQFVDHLPAALESDLPRGPDQLRTALRRLRAAIRFFDLREDRFHAHDQPWRAIDRMAAELLGAIGPLCRGDRVRLGVLPVLDETHPRDPALAQLASALDALREDSCRQMRLHLLSPPTTEFILLTTAALDALPEPVANAVLPVGSSATSAFDGYAARRLGLLASRLYEQAGDAAVNGDWGSVRAGLRQLRQALKAAGDATPGVKRPRRLLDRLQRWDRWLADEREVTATRETVVRAMRDVDASDAMLARVTGLVDGYWAFACQHRTGADPAQRHLRRAMKQREEPAPGAGAATPYDEAGGPAGRADKLRRLLRRHFELEAGLDDAPRGPQRTAPAAGAAVDLAGPGSPSDDHRIIDLSGRARPSRRIGDMLASSESGGGRDDAEPDDEDLDDDIDDDQADDLHTRIERVAILRPPPSGPFGPMKRDLH